MKKRSKNYFVAIALLAVVLTTGASTLSWGEVPENAGFKLADVRRQFPRAGVCKKMEDKSVQVLDDSGKVLGYILLSSDFGVHNKGFAGDVPLLIALNDNKIIVGVYLLKNNEEDDFIDKVKDAKLLDSWNNKPLDALLVRQNVDAVTGATYSSNAIIKTVRQTVAAYIHDASPVDAPEASNKKSSALLAQHPLVGGQKISVGSKPFILPKPALVVGSYSAAGEPDIMTAAWAGIANSNPLCVAVSIRSSRKTYENIKSTGCFTINVPAAANAAQMDYCGVVSGHDENKFQSLHLTPVEGQYVHAPYVAEFPVVLECKLIDTIRLGSHTQFIGQVMDTKVNADILTPGRQIDVEKMHPVIFDESGYYTFGKFLGKPFDLYKTVGQSSVTQMSQSEALNPTLTTIMNRKSVRHYTDRQVSKNQLSLLVRAGMAAPSAVDKRPWVFVAISSRSMLDRLAAVLPYAQMLKQATAAIVVGGDMNKTLNGDAKSFWVQDCSAATENILLAAESLQLGAVWTGVHPNAERESAVRNVLSMPENVTPLCVIAIGYPTGQEKPKDKWNESLLHWDRW